VDLSVSPIALDAPLTRPDAGPPEQQGPTLGDGDTAVLDEPGDVDDLYLSCVLGKGVVTRFGATGAAFIGARRDPSAEGGIAYNPEQVVRVPGSDARRYAREYQRVLAEGSVRIRSREEYLAYRKLRDEALRAAKAQREQARAEAVKAALAPAAEDQTPPAAPAASDNAPAAPADPSTTGG
jgi:hypothetical protein